MVKDLIAFFLSSYRIINTLTNLFVLEIECPGECGFTFRAAYDYYVHILRKNNQTCMGKYVDFFGELPKDKKDRMPKTTLNAKLFQFTKKQVGETPLPDAIPNQKPNPPQQESDEGSAAGS